MNTMEDVKAKLNFLISFHNNRASGSNASSRPFKSAFESHNVSHRATIKQEKTILSL